MRLVSENLNILQIAESGQCFRMNKIDENKYNLIAYGRYLEIIQSGRNEFELSCSEEEYQQVWRNYFDLDYDYGSIINALTEGEDEFLKSAAEYGNGIRILQQEPFEMLISFIISQNKNIPSIKNCIERICEKYGDRNVNPENNVVYYTFPLPKQLVNATQEELRELKLGYRDEYILGAARAVVEGNIDLNALKACSHEEAVVILKGLKGIGDKVANCVSLYGLHHIEAFPIDVWISKVLVEIYNNNFNVDLYKGYAGIIQQYMFYYIRAVNGARA
ncbi:MAG TPA: DNA glycosylase [Mobilitalea sp.]|nr:DNA glycosylase [Mobilitalea sp.]